MLLDYFILLTQLKKIGEESLYFCCVNDNFFIYCVHSKSYMLIITIIGHVVGINGRGPRSLRFHVIWLQTPRQRNFITSKEHLNVPWLPLFIFLFFLYHLQPELKDRDNSPVLLEGFSSFKLIWMESTFPCNSLIGYSLEWRCCSSVWPKSLWQNSVLTTRLSSVHARRREREIVSHIRRQQKVWTSSKLFHLQLTTYAWTQNPKCRLFLKIYQ